MLPYLTVHGRLTADPELRFTPNGKAVASFTVAASERRKNRTTDEWEDGDKCFLRCSVWEQAAENVTEAFAKGDQVVVTGRLFQREYTDREGAKRTSTEVKVDSVSAEVGRFQQVKVIHAERGSRRESAPAQSSDPWGSVPLGEEAPF